MLIERTAKNSNTNAGFQVCQAKCLALVLGVASVLVGSGCRSMPGMRGLNMFARNKEPSAELLAGTGPSTTYPAPPSSSATPQAIASIAGGTQVPSQTGTPTTIPTNPMNPSGTMQVAGVDISPGYASPTTNYAAAQANGVYSQPASTPSPNSGSVAAKPSAYTFGSKAFAPKSNPQTASATTPTMSGGYASSAPSMPASNPTLNGATANGSAPSYAPPSMATMAAAQPTPTTTASAKPSSSGFSLPTDLPNLGSAVSAITPPPSSGSQASSSSYSLPPANGAAASSSTANMAMPGNATAASFSTANASGAMGGPESGTVKPISSYMPGSTGQTSGYPSGNEAPTTSGSFYR